ncbi:MAG: acid--CoA ligase [Gammaproteobacteria bacterium]|nr:acid--CoA ligase [Gammaproteobacteria bacterium]
MSDSALDPSAWIQHHATKTPTRIALHYEGEQITYRDLAYSVATFARFFAQDLKLPAGTRIAYLGANTPEELALLFACACNAQVFVPLNWRLEAPELDAILHDCNPSVLIVEASCLGLAQTLRVDLPHRLTVGASNTGWPALPLPLANMTEEHAGDLDRPLLLAYTSGTTGSPKGAVLSAGALMSNARNSIHMHGLVASDRVLTALPLFHVGGLNIQTSPALYVGAEVILLPRFEPSRALATIAELHPSLAVLVPATLQAMLDHPSWKHTDLSSLRTMTTGSTDVPPALIHAWHARGVPIIQVYGATETAPIAIYQRLDEAFSTLGAIGRAGQETEVRLVNAEGRDCAVDEPGEIWVRGAHVAGGYWNQLQAVSFTQGWFRSGDVALCDAQGVFWFKDRIKNVVISGGENIYPAELERILLEHPAIKEAAIVGRPHPHWGAVPVAFVVRQAPIDRDDIVGLFAGRVARYKIPQEIIALDALPRTTFGKIDHASLRHQIAVLPGASTR